jgi:hypothetical protein
MKSLVLRCVLALAATLMFAACSKDGDGSSDPFGGGGGGNGNGNSAAIVGKWTSVSATGTVGYTGDLGPSLANAINENIASFILTNVIVFQFDADGKVTMSLLGEIIDQGKWSLNGKALTLTDDQNDSFTCDMVNEKEFKYTGLNTDISAYVAWAIGNAVLNTNNYGGMSETGTQVSTANLSIKFQKQ